MNPSPQGHYQAAEEAFMESLDQLEQSLQECESSSAQLNTLGQRPVELPQAQSYDRIDMEALEAAAADIEQFMQTKDSNINE